MKSKKIGYLASRAQPYDSFSDVVISSEYMLLSVMLNDYSDEVLETTDFTKYIDNIISILRGNKINIKKDYFFERMGRLVGTCEVKYTIRVAKSNNKKFGETFKVYYMGCNKSIK